MKHTPLTLLAVISLALVGCGSTEATSEEPQSREEAQQQYKDMLESGEAQGPPPMPAGEYTAQAEAVGTIVMQIPASTDDELISQIEAYREAVNAEPVTYLIADVDNREGSDSIGMRKVKVFDAEGVEYEFTDAADLIEEWGPHYTSDYEYKMPNGDIIPNDEANALREQESELHDNLTGSVSAAGRDTIILTYQGDDLPDEYTRVAVQPGPLGEEVDAYPTDWNN